MVVQVLADWQPHPDGKAKAKQIDRIKKQMQGLMHAASASYDME